MEAYSILKKQQWLVLICILAGHTNFFQTAVSEIQPHPSPIQLKNKQVLNDLNSFELAYADDRIALFFESADSKIIHQLVFSPVADSDIWIFKDKINYTASTGEKMPIIYIVHHSRESKQINTNELQNSEISLNATCNYLDNIKCFESSNISILNQENEFLIPYKNSKIRSEIVPIINFVIATYDPEIQSVLASHILDILVYDNLTQMGNSETAQAFLEEAINQTANFERGRSFSGWYLPIYRHHGGSKSIAMFMNLLKSYSKGNNSNHNEGNKTLNSGEFVHIWSEATGTDLRYLIHRFFKRDELPRQTQIEFEMARKRFTTYNYSETFSNGSLNLLEKHWKIDLFGNTWNLTLRHSSKHVAYYSDESVPSYFTFPHITVSKAWQYVTETYQHSALDQLPIYFVILRAGNESKCRSIHFKKEYNFRSVIDCQEVSSKGWNDQEDYLVGLFVNFVGRMTTKNTPVAHTFLKPIKDDGEQALLDIVVYDIFVGIGRFKEAEWLSETKAAESNSYPRKNTKWFRDWFLPIYSNFEKTKTLQSFFTHLHINWPHKETEREMNLGEFVHLWSGTVGQDLQGLAMETFGWEKQYDKELLQARISYPQLTYLYTPINSSVPQSWNKKWKNYDKASNLVYVDDQIACYFSSDVNSSISFPFKLMSDSWKYAKEKFGPLGYDPILYINIHRNTSSCRASKENSYFDADYGNRNVIDCGIMSADDYAWNFNSSENKDDIMSQLGKLILRNARETGNWPGFASSRWSMVSIVVYDIYKGLGIVQSAKKWRRKMVKLTEDIPSENWFWFRDWYYPIYKKYGEAHALNRFLSVVNANWPQKDQDYIGDYNLGELVHFWSIAVGENLWPLADEAFGCCAWDQKTYLKARKEYLTSDYTDETNNLTVKVPYEKWVDSDKKVSQNLRLVYADLHFAAYFDSEVDPRTTWPFEQISKAWRYAKTTYGPFEPGAILYLLIQITARDTNGYSRGKSYQEDNLENRTVIYSNGSNSFWNSIALVRHFIRLIGVTVLTQAKKTGNWPSVLVSEWEMKYIIAYDVLQGIGSSVEAIIALKATLNFTSDLLQESTFWSRDWFYPIYVNYGRANVLNNFLNLLSKHWQKVPKGLGHDYVKQLNVGEFVHFWSGAAGVNLRYLADKTLQWNHEYSVQLEKAIELFPMITYNDTKHKVELNAAEEVLKEGQFEHSELLLKVSGTSEITIYFDAKVNHAVKWPIDLLSKAWTQTKSNYGTVKNALDPHLIVFLHGTKHTGCRTSFKLHNNTEHKNILDCGKSPTGSDKWATSNSDNRLILIYGFAKLIQRSAKQIEGNEAYDSNPFSQILAYDIFLRLGYFKDAQRLLTATYNTSKMETALGKFWIRDWYYPLYTQYGQSSILDNFVALLSTTWAQKKESVSYQKINVGQNIHFWSASAGTNLYNFSQLVYGNNMQHYVQFLEAKKDFPLLNYSCYNCEPQIIQAKRIENEMMDFGVLVSVGFACIVFPAFLISLVIYKKKLQRLEHEMRELTAEEIKEFFEGSNKADEDAHFCIESKPFNADYKIPRESLEIDFNIALGSGEFGLIYRGLLKPNFEVNEDLIHTVVAVKTVKPNVNVFHFKTILTELKVMGYLGSHANIVSLLGAHTVNIRMREVYIALEFCSKGDLLGFLQKNRTFIEDLFAKKAEVTEKKLDLKTVINVIDIKPKTIVADNSKFCSQRGQDVEKARTSNEIDKSESLTCNPNSNTADAFSALNLLKWSSQIASGMEFIASKNVIHGDLAARNVLLTEDNVAKISDFGLSRQLQNYAFYIKTSKTPVPWRWMAIESLRDMKFSVQSDAWSFGVVLYEIFSLGTMPYAGWAWDYEFIDKLVAGHRLSAPEFGNESVYKLMMDCMQKEASERITFSQAICRLEQIKVEICRERAPINASKYLKLTS